jgi:hypothetical protein
MSFNFYNDSEKCSSTPDRWPACDHVMPPAPLYKEGNLFSFLHLHLSSYISFP